MSKVREYEIELVAENFWQVYVDGNEVGQVVCANEGSLPFKALRPAESGAPTYDLAAHCATLDEAAEVLAGPDEDVECEICTQQYPRSEMATEGDNWSGEHPGVPYFLCHYCRDKLNAHD